MNALFEIVRNQMQKHNVKQYHMDTVFVEVTKGSVDIIPSENDFYFFANAFSDSGILKGKIRGTAGGNALSIDAKTLSMKLHKFQMFKGEIRFSNLNKEATLYVELLRITPIPQKNINE